MEWAIEKCTELNVTTIVLVIARRTERHLALAAGQARGALADASREKQVLESRRITPPEIADPVKLAEVLNLTAELRIVLAETEREATLTDTLRSATGASSLALAIGPEGGWTDDELSSFQTSQWIAASLGDCILRAETAAIAALAIARSEL